MDEVREKIDKKLQQYVKDILDAGEPLIRRSIRHNIVDDIMQLIQEERNKAKEETYEDVLYRLSFMDAEDTIDDVIADITHKQNKLKQSLEEKE